MLVALFCLKSYLNEEKGKGENGRGGNRQKEREGTEGKDMSFFKAYQADTFVKMVV
jgi:hypothetical protein